ncbi:MAG: NAD(P)H-hydrate dehydratase [Spirochaetes bacterium]|nr:NAD(P)H-hydrate dehydratase [Spirochaetota bacterium]
MFLTKNSIIQKNEAVLLDKKAIEINNIPPLLLMEEAAGKIVTQLKNDFVALKDEKIAIISGWGNNGGDALSVARKLFFEGITTDIYIFSDKNGSELFETQKNILLSLSINLLDVKNLENNINNYTLIIDGIFGIGYSYREDKKLEDLFLLINESKSNIISIDVPSGLNNELHPSIIAAYTYSIGFLKEYFLNINTRKCLGIIRDLKISFDLNNIKLAKNILYYNSIIPIKKNKNNFVHKYSRGGCISIGGQKGKLGSILFTAESALRIGCGITLIITEETNIIPINTMSKNVIVDNFENYELYIDKYNAIIIGPGLNYSIEKNKEITKTIIKKDKQFILDASFFTLFDKNILKLFKTPPLLTPHTQEFKYFFTEESAGLNNNSIKTVSDIAQKYNAFILLKDSFLIFALPNGETIVYDNPMRILAQAGSGDMLTGIIGGIVSQGYSLKESVLEGIRVFYNIAEKLNSMNYVSYSPDMFIDMIGNE